MKTLRAAVDRKEFFKIEAARISYEILSSAYEELTGFLRQFEKDDRTYPVALAAIRQAWQFIDYSFRFMRIVDQIRNLAHKDPRYKNAAKCLEHIEKARNFIQHLASGIPKQVSVVYPVLGVLAWASESREKSFTLSLGTLPPGTHFHTLAYDREKERYAGGFHIYVDTFNVNLTESFSKIKGCSEYLNEWLQTNKMLSDTELIPTLMEADALNVQADYRYVRVLMSTNEAIPQPIAKPEKAD